MGFEIWKPEKLVIKFVWPKPKFYVWIKMYDCWGYTICLWEPYVVSLPGKCLWVLKHNSRFWPAWVLIQDITSARLYRSCYIDPLKWATCTWALTRDGRSPGTLWYETFNEKSGGRWQCYMYILQTKSPFSHSWSRTCIIGIMRIKILFCEHTTCRVPVAGRMCWLHENWTDSAIGQAAVEPLQ